MHMQGMQALVTDAKNPGAWESEHLKAAIEHLKANRRSLAAVRYSLAAVRCYVAPRLPGLLHIWPWFREFHILISNMYIKGLAIGLQESQESLISIFVAVIVHKAVMAFSLGQFRN